MNDVGTERLTVIEGSPQYRFQGVIELVGVTGEKFVALFQNATEQKHLNRSAIADLMRVHALVSTGTDYDSEQAQKAWNYPYAELILARDGLASYYPDEPAIAEGDAGE